MDSEWIWPLLGVGIDLVDLTEFSRLLEKKPKIIEKLFRDEEKMLTVRQLAGNFAVKESLFKVLQRQQRKDYLDCWVSRGDEGKPELILVGDLATSMKFKDIHVSITNKSNLVIALVVID